MGVWHRTIFLIIRARRRPSTRTPPKMTMRALVSSSLNHRSLRVRWYEVWSVALSRRGLRRGVDDVVVGGRLHRTVASTVQWKGPNLGSDVGYRGLFVVTGRDPQCLILDHFKFIHMGGAPFCEPYGCGIV